MGETPNLARQEGVVAAAAAVSIRIGEAASASLMQPNGPARPPSLSTTKDRQGPLSVLV